MDIERNDHHDEVEAQNREVRETQERQNDAKRKEEHEKNGKKLDESSVIEEDPSEKKHTDTDNEKKRESKREDAAEETEKTKEGDRSASGGKRGETEEKRDLARELDGKDTIEPNNPTKEEIRDRIRKNSAENRLAIDSSRYQEGGPDSHSDAKAKFTAKDFDRLADNQGKRAYEKAIDEGATKEDAEAKRQEAIDRVNEKKESFGKFHPEQTRLKHADAVASEAKEQALADGKTENQANRAYNQSFRETYAGDHAKEARDKAIKDGKSPEEADAVYQAEYDKRYDLSKKNDMRPDSKYFETYDSKDTDDVTVQHAEKVDDKVFSYGESSGIYTTPDKHSSARETKDGLALPVSNDAQQRHEEKYNEKNDDGVDQFVIQGKVASQREAKISGEEHFSDGTDNRQKVDGGGEQYVLTGGGKYDGGIREVKDTQEVQEAKEAYLDKLKEQSACPETIPENAAENKWEKQDTETVRAEREEFNGIKNTLINEWEEKNQEEWPRYEEDVVGENGTVIHRAGDRYDAHHIQPLEYGGMNTSDNITPIESKKHIGADGIHQSAEYKNLQSAMKENAVDAEEEKDDLP